MEQLEFMISFPEENVARGNVLAPDLREAVLDSHPDVEATVKRSDPGSMDFGTTLAVVLSGKAIIAVAKGIQEWLKAHRRVTVKIERPDGTIVAENLTGGQALDLVRLTQAGAGPSTG